MAAHHLAKEHPGKMVTVTNEEGDVLYDTLCGSEETKYASQPWASVKREEEEDATSRT